MLNATHTTCALSAPPRPRVRSQQRCRRHFLTPAAATRRFRNIQAGLRPREGIDLRLLLRGKRCRLHNTASIVFRMRCVLDFACLVVVVVLWVLRIRQREAHATTAVYFIAFAWVRTPEVPSCWRGDFRVHIFSKGVCCARTQRALCRKVACCVFSLLPPKAFVFELKLHRCCCPALVVVPTYPGHRSPSKYQPATVGHSSASGNRCPITALGSRRQPATRRGYSGAISDSSSAVGRSSGAIRNLRRGRHDSRNRGSSKA